MTPLLQQDIAILMLAAFLVFPYIKIALVYHEVKTR